MLIRRAWIARCQVVTSCPNFVVLLGNRHGWRALPDEIPAAEFEAILPHLTAELANGGYKLDENIVCPRTAGPGPDKGVYVQQSRTHVGNWADDVEGPLSGASHRAALAFGLPEVVRRKHEASATHQEIYSGTFDKPDSQEHVVAFVREMRTAEGQSLREALLPDAALKDFLDLKHNELDRESQEQLDAVKRKLRDKLGPNCVKTHSARRERRGATTAHVTQLCADVYRRSGR